MTRRQIHLATLALFTALSLRAQNPEDAEALLRRTAQTYRGAQSFLFVAAESTVTASGDQRRETKDFVLTAKHQDGRTRVEFDNGREGGAAVYDGRDSWVYLPRAKRFAKLKAATEVQAGGFNFGAIRTRFINRYQAVDERIIEARITGSEAIRLQDREASCQKVEISYNPPPGLREGEIDRIYWIETSTALIVRERSIASMIAPNSTQKVTVTQDLEFQAATTEDDLDSGLFQFVPPPGAQRVESFVDDAPAGEPVDMEAPDLTLESFAGVEVQLTKLRGKVVLLDFWATWCGPCRYDMPHVQRLHEEFSDDGLVVYGVNAEQVAVAKSYLDENSYSFGQLKDARMRAARLFHVRAIPTFVVIDRQGRISSYFQGTRPYEVLRQAVEKAGI